VCVYVCLCLFACVLQRTNIPSFNLSLGLLPNSDNFFCRKTKSDETCWKESDSEGMPVMTNSALLRRIVQMLIILSTNVTCSEADKTFNRTN